METRRWWEDRPGVWEHEIEEGLASRRPRLVGLCWAIVMVTGGKSGRSRADFARETGISESAISNAFAGKSFGPKQIKRILESTDLREDLFERGNHPFALSVSYLGRVIEPGDPLWRGMWEIVASENGDARSPAELQREFPDLFPS